MKQRKAFTIIELMLAMSFLGTMLLGIASLIMQITNIYQKGLAIRGVNTVGREIISDLTRTVQASRVSNLSINPSTEENSNKISLEEVRRARADYYVEILGDDGKQLGGAFCTGSYSYVWNTADNLRIARAKATIKDGKVIDGTEDVLVHQNKVLTIKAMKNDSDDEQVLIVPKLVRFPDYDRDACLHDDSENMNMIGDDSNPIKKSETLFDLSEKMHEKNINELIEENEADLALYEFTVLPATQNYTTKQIFYPGTFILATYRGGVNITSNGDFCQGSDGNDGAMDDEYTGNDFDYCAVNKFNFAVRATGETGINQHGDN